MSSSFFKTSAGIAAHFNNNRTQPMDTNPDTWSNGSATFPNSTNTFTSNTFTTFPASNTFPRSTGTSSAFPTFPTYASTQPRATVTTWVQPNTNYANYTNNTNNTTYGTSPNCYTPPSVVASMTYEELQYIACMVYQMICNTPRYY